MRTKTEMARFRGRTGNFPGCLAHAVKSVVFVLAVCPYGLVTADAGLPDIVVYLSDDHSQIDSSVYGNENIPTPNMERLAADGMTFTHAFVASPSCAPSRAALLTGLMPTRNGAETNHSVWDESVPDLVDQFQRLGYEVAAFGKVAHGRIQPPRIKFDHVAFGATIDRLRRDVTRFLKNRDPDVPLCLFVGTSNPHVPWSQRATISPDDVELPPRILDTSATRRHRSIYYQEIIDLDAFLGELREISTEFLGRDTIFVHSSDHGAQWPFGKWNLYDYGTRVPLIIACPDRIEPGSTSTAMVSWVDLLPTLIELAGGAVPTGLDGRSFADVVLGRSLSHRTEVFTTHTADGTKNAYPMRSVRTPDWKLIENLRPDLAHTNHSDLDRKPLAGAYWHEWAELMKQDAAAGRIVDQYFRRPRWELYHVAADPWELENLVDDPAHFERFTALRARLREWMDSQGDDTLVEVIGRPLIDPDSWHPSRTASEEIR
ncbi:MAG: sulfatase [Planctomycetota bacterium]